VKHIYKFWLALFSHIQALIAQNLKSVELSSSWKIYLVLIQGSVYVGFYTPLRHLIPPLVYAGVHAVIQNVLILQLILSYSVRIRVRIDPPHPLVCRKRRQNRVVLRMRPENLRSRVTVGVAR
jgi:hypothetical protein